MFKYSINLVWSDNDESYVATIPEFPGLSAFGKTPGEAIKEAITACELFIEDMIEEGEEIPKPETISQYYKGEGNYPGSKFQGSQLKDQRLGEVARLAALRSS